jgi:hypothetical protein
MAAITEYITSGTSWTVPANWNDAINTIECIGAGGAGGNNGGGGGGAGAYAKLSNLALTPSDSITIQIGAAHAWTSANNHLAAWDTYFNGANLAASSCGAEGGYDGYNTVGGTATAGSAANSIGDTKYNGGTGGQRIDNGAERNGGGGGGAGGPDGAGANGGNATTTIGGAGGQGGNGSGGAGGTAGSGGDGGNGAAGTEMGDSKGSGGGGGGADTGFSAGTSGAYGSGGGGGGNAGGGSNGAAGLIKIVYTPVVSGASSTFGFFLH